MSEQPPSANKRIGRYELLKQIDRGFLGPLWAARFDHQGTSLAALVRVVETPPNVDAELWDALSDAAWTAIDLQVPGVVHCADVVFQSNTLALVDDYVEGQPLSALSRPKGNNDPSFPLGIALRIVLDALEALQELSAGSATLGADTVHGGISPDVLLVGTDGMTRILNPLVSAAATNEEYFRSLPERAPYVAPEQWLLKASDERADVYSVGCILWELLSRKRLHAGSAANIRRCATSPRLPAPLMDARANMVPSPVLETLRNALAPDQTARYATLRAFADALQKASPTVATASEVAHYVENMASARLEEQRTATENSTVAHLTDFFKAERPASVHPPAQTTNAPIVKGPSKVKLGLALHARAKQQTKSASPPASGRLKSVAPVSPNLSTSTRPKSMPAPGAVLRHVVVPVAPANDANLGRAAAAPRNPKANTTLLGISPQTLQANAAMAQTAAARAAAAAPELVDLPLTEEVPSNVFPQAAVTVPAPAAQANIYEEESLTIPYEDMLTASKLALANVGRAHSPAMASLGDRVTVPDPSLPPVTETRPAIEVPASSGSAALAEVSAQTVSLVELRSTSQRTPSPQSPEAYLPGPLTAKKSWPAVTWFFMGCTVSLGVVVVAGALRSNPTPSVEHATVKAAAAIQAPGTANDTPVILVPSAPAVPVPAAPANVDAPATSPSVAVPSVVASAVPAASAAPVASDSSQVAPTPSAPAAAISGGALIPAPKVPARPRSNSKPTTGSKGTGRSKYVPKDL